jgi:hypothetical protein
VCPHSPSASILYPAAITMGRLCFELGPRAGISFDRPGLALKMPGFPQKNRNEMPGATICLRNPEVLRCECVMYRGGSEQKAGFGLQKLLLSP